MHVIGAIFEYAGSVADGLIYSAIFPDGLIWAMGIKASMSMILMLMRILLCAMPALVKGDGQKHKAMQQEIGI